VINSPPEVVVLSVDPNENLIQMPSPIRHTMHRSYSPLSNFQCKDWPEPVPPGTHRFVADIDAAFVKQVLDLAQR